MIINNFLLVIGIMEFYYVIHIWLKNKIFTTYNYISDKSLQL
jgi:hypothetical protein